MESLLPKPTPKKRSREYFPRQAPFPIFGEFSETVEAFGRKKQRCFLGYLQEDCVLVTDKESMKSLYRMGFFGKGTLSRGGPKICFPREEESQDAADKGNKRSSNTEESSDDDEQEHSWKRRKLSGSKTDKVDDDDIIDEQAPAEEALPEEKLQLSFEESFFLSYGLGCLVVLDKDQPLDLQRLWQRLCDLTPHRQFPSMYTAYHHFRSKGWIVRCGIKYGADFLLYKDGPYYYHSTYVVIVRPLTGKNFKDILNKDKLPITWFSLAAKNRLLSQVSKGLLYLYVIKPEILSENKISTPFCVSQFKVQEVFVKRWVCSTGREEDDESENV